MNYLAIRPTGNCKPAFADRETAFLEDFPLPRPDIFVCVVCFKMRKFSSPMGNEKESHHSMHLSNPYLELNAVFLVSSDQYRIKRYQKLILDE